MTVPMPNDDGSDWRREAPLPPGVRKGIEEFNRREFFECHETIEAVWLVADDRVRAFYQGILQLGVACYHVENGNWRGATNLLSGGIDKLIDFGPVWQGVDVEGLLAQARRCEEEMGRLGPEKLGKFDRAFFPTIKFTGAPGRLPPP